MCHVRFVSCLPSNLILPKRPSFFCWLIAQSAGKGTLSKVPLSFQNLHLFYPLCGCGTPPQARIHDFGWGPNPQTGSSTLGHRILRQPPKATCIRHCKNDFFWSDSHIDKTLMCICFHAQQRTAHENSRKKYFCLNSKLFCTCSMKPLILGVICPAYKIAFSA